MAWLYRRVAATWISHGSYPGSLRTAFDHPEYSPLVQAGVPEIVFLRILATADAIGRREGAATPDRRLPWLEMLYRPRLLLTVLTTTMELDDGLGTDDKILCMASDLVTHGTAIQQGLRDRGRGAGWEPYDWGEGGEG